MVADNLYSAVYSGVPVYEFIHPKSSVMRRKQDGWINATHILKVADFPKARRTRILEKDVQTGVHEKVQGGYGKYQGTWVPITRAIEIAKEFGVYEELATLFDYRPSGGASSPPPAPKHHHATSSRRGRGGARAAGRSAGVTSKATALKRSSSTASENNSKRRVLKAPKPLPVSTSNLTSSVKLQMSSSESDFDTVSTPDDNKRPRSRDNDSIDKKFANEVPPSNNESSASEFLSDEDLDNALRPHSNNGASSVLQRGSHGSGNSGQAAIANHQEWVDPKKIFTQKLLEYFLSNEDGVGNGLPMPSFIKESNTGFNVDEPIDKDGNTTFHWACAMGDLKMCDALLARGANYRILNNAGQVPIMRSVLYNNSYVRRTFAKLLDLLRDTLLDSDTQGRTILHHIAFSTNSHNNLPSARYYSEILVTKVAETVQPVERIINFINQQDHEGNTALHILSYNGALKCIRVLLSYNARVDIPNNRNEFVSDYLYSNGFEPIQQVSTGLATNAPNSLNSMSQLRPFNPVADTSIGSQHISILNASNYLAIPHYSEAAMQVTQKSGEIMEKLGELSNAFDVELQQKDTDIKELSAILSEMDNDITKTNKDIKEILTTILNEDNPDSQKLIKLEDFEGSLKLLEEELRNADSEYLLKTAQLKKLIERSQAKDLAMIVQKYENDKLKEELGGSDKNGETNEEDAINQLKASEMNSKNVGLILELIKLQIIRKRTVHGLVELYADASENTETISSYRRLVSKLSNVPLDEVDESLNDIEDCLKDEDL